MCVFRHADSAGRDCFIDPVIEKYYTRAHTHTHFKVCSSSACHNAISLFPSLSVCLSLLKPKVCLLWTVRCSRKSPDTQRAEKCSDINNVRLKWQEVRVRDLAFQPATARLENLPGYYNETTRGLTFQPSQHMAYYAGLSRPGSHTQQTANTRVCVCVIFSFTNRDQVSSQW